MVKSCLAMLVCFTHPVCTSLLNSFIHGIWAIGRTAFSYCTFDNAGKYNFINLSRIHNVFVRHPDISTKLLCKIQPSLNCFVGIKEM